MADKEQAVLSPVHRLEGDSKLVVKNGKITVDYDKKIVCKLLNNRWTIKITSAEGKQILVPREARLVAIAIRRQQRIDAQRDRRNKKVSNRAAQAVGV